MPPTPPPPNLIDTDTYEVKLLRPVQWGGNNARPLLPHQKHWITGAVIKQMWADTTNDGAIEVFGIVDQDGQAVG
jgi:hypothetical protein